MMVYRWQGQDGPPRHTCLSWRTPPWSTPTHLDTHPEPVHHPPWCHQQSTEPSSVWRALGPGLKTHPDTVTASYFKMCNSKERAMQRPLGSSYRVALSLWLSQCDETQYQCSWKCAKTIKVLLTELAISKWGFITTWVLSWYFWPSLLSVLITL